MYLIPILLPQASLPQCQTLHDFHNVQCLFLFSGSLLTMLLALNTLLFLCVSDFTSVNPHLIYPDTTAASCLCAHMPFCNIHFLQFLVYHIDIICVYIHLFLPSHCEVLKGRHLISSFSYPASHRAWWSTVWTWKLYIQV